MLTIFASSGTLAEVQEIIDSEDRLNELVSVEASLERLPSASGFSLIVDARGIIQPIDWENVSPPYLFARGISLQQSSLLGILFARLGNGEKAWSYLQEHPMLAFDLGVSSRLQHGIAIDLEEFSAVLPHIDKSDPFEKYRLLHNAAVVRHYGFIDDDLHIDEVIHFYQNAIKQAPAKEYAAFTARHYAGLLVDTDQPDKAVSVLEEALNAELSEDARFGLKSILTNAWMKQLTVPYDPALLEQLKATLWEVLQYNERKGRQAEIAMLLVDAAHIANISDSFSESLGYITRAIRIFEAEELEELAAQAHLRKGTLLYTWAQQGNPQFYKPAIDSYQQALKVFRQEVTPDVFADIHHHLAVLYSEMPSDSKKKGIWAGIASASFQEALNYYTRDNFPYEYGMICNNYGNALTRFPQAIHSDNFEKALFYYQEALGVRTPDQPYERAITLLNFLEASWKVSNDEEGFNEERYNDMVAKAQEVKSLVTDAGMLEEAQKHLDLLEELKQVSHA
ncbi:MAG: hypothetical protein R2824_22755 [Saprospiraceae bacterium]|nr:hypothetical protein [Lewinella sp.]